MTRLRNQVRSAPSPTSYAGLAERLVASDELDEALQVAEEGLSRFPDAERLAQVRLYAMKGQRAGRIRELKEDVRRQPTPEAFTELAEIYRELKSYDEALDMATRCSQRYPQHEGPHLIQGEIRLERFVKDKVANDGLLAKQSLDEVLRLNPHSPKAHLLLGELDYLVGDIESCRTHLRQVLTLLPSAREVQEFLRDTDARPAGQGDSPEFKDLAELVEKSSAFANPVDAFPRTRAQGGAAARSLAIDTVGLRAEVARFGDHDGLRNALILDASSAVMADFSGADGLPRDAFSALVASIGSTADGASRRMDIGTLVRAEIFGPTGNLTVARLRGLTIAILYATPLRAASVWDLTQDFVARNLTETEEFASA